MLRSQPNFVGLALARLRLSVLVCCWVIALALAAQLGVWITATFTDARHETLRGAPAAPQMIVSSGAQHQNIAGGVEAADTTAIKRAADAANADPNRVLSKYDRILEMTSKIASGAGLLALMVLLPLMILGVLLAAGSATPGVDQTVAAFTWAIVLALLILPMGDFVGLPWREGALSAYSSLTSEIDATRGGVNASFNATFYARFAMLPLACIIGAGMIGLRFCAGVDAALPKKEDMRLDPTLEREAGNISPTSLHGGRAASALRAAAAPPAPAAAPHPAGMTVPTAGVAPKRLI